MSILYKVRDLQFPMAYFGNGRTFKSKREICEALISFHSVDCDMTEEQKLLDEGKIEKCLDLLSEFEWEIEAVEGESKI